MFFIQICKLLKKMYVAVIWLTFLWHVLQGESTDNFNWGVRRRPLSEGEGEGEQSQLTLEESLSEKTPVLSARKVRWYQRRSLVVFLGYTFLLSYLVFLVWDAQLKPKRKYEQFLLI